MLMGHADTISIHDPGYGIITGPFPGVTERTPESPWLTQRGCMTPRPQATHIPPAVPVLPAFPRGGVESRCPSPTKACLRVPQAVVPLGNSTNVSGRGAPRVSQGSLLFGRARLARPSTPA